MGDFCLEKVVSSFIEYEYLENLTVNLNRNDLSAHGIKAMVENLGDLGMLRNLYITAKKNLRKVDQKEMVRQALNKLMIKNKKIVL